jgi:Tfp pilus assembly protein PilE
MVMKLDNNSKEQGRGQECAQEAVNVDAQQGARISNNISSSRKRGFTLVELVFFVVILGILAGTILYSFIIFLTYSPSSSIRQSVAMQSVANCIEWFLGQRYMNGYSSITCPSTTVPSFCTAPSGYTLAVNITCTTIGSDTNYKTIVVSSSGNIVSSMSLLIGSY